jgi:regulation of enolase protein 1 (concanavalin A-like superfamily)
VSPDGSTWTVVGSETIPMAASILVGLAVSSHNNTELATATFDGVSVASGGTPGDTTPPVTSITSPANGAEVSGVITVAATASDDVGVGRVELWLDGALLATDTSAPYEFPWDTASAANGSHTLQTRAYDAAANAGSSGAVTVQVANGGTPGGLPAPWAQAGVGSVNPAGTASASDGTFTIEGAGADVWGTADAFHYVYQPMTGNAEIVARVASVENVDQWTKAGVMMRESLDAGARHAFMLVSPGKGLAFQRRTTTNGTSTNTSGGSGTAPAWVKLVRTGSTFSAYRSGDGVSWTLVGSDAIPMGSTILVGLAVSSHRDGTLASAVFDGVDAASTELPAPWAGRDIGAVGRAGSGSAAGPTFTVSGSGADIWDTADAFHYVYQPFSGDGEIVARVATLQNTDRWAKAGVMMRESLDAGAAHAAMFVSAEKGLAFQRRVTPGGESSHTSGGAGTAPRWVRLVRSGATLSAYVSTDGASWTLVGTETISMETTIYVGLAVTAHDNSALCAASFDSVTVTGS